MERINRQTVIQAAIAAVVLWSIGFGLMLLDIEVIDVVVIGLGSLAGAISWIVALLIAARRQQWVWVVVIALLNFLGGIIYVAAGTDDTA